jgi:type IV secretory pathway TraG/TraD family ATPase VirD4
MLVHGRHNGTSQGATANRSEGYTEREQPLLLPHEVLQLDAEQVIAFAGGTPPARLGRIDWRSDRELSDLVGQEPPDVPAIPAVTMPDWPAPTKPTAAAASSSTLGRDY